MNKKVLLLLPQGFEEYEVAVFTDILGWSRDYGDEHVMVDSVGIREKVTCTFNLQVIPQYQLSEINLHDYSALAIPGGYETAGFYEDAWSEEVLELIRSFDTARKPIAAICVAALALGKAGILKGKRATTYHLNDGIRRKQLTEFGAVVEDKRLVVDNNIITCTGPGAAADVAFELLEKLTSPKTRELIWKQMGFDLK